MWQWSLVRFKETPPPKLASMNSANQQFLKQPRSHFDSNNSGETPPWGLLLPTYRMKQNDVKTIRVSLTDSNRLRSMRKMEKHWFKSFLLKLVKPKLCFKTCSSHSEILLLPLSCLLLAPLLPIYLDACSILGLTRAPCVWLRTLSPRTAKRAGCSWLQAVI